MSISRSDFQKKQNYQDELSTRGYIREQYSKDFPTEIAKICIQYLIAEASDFFDKKVADSSITVFPKKVVMKKDNFSKNYVQYFPLTLTYAAEDKVTWNFMFHNLGSDCGLGVIVYEPKTHENEIVSSLLCHFEWVQRSMQASIEVDMKNQDFLVLVGNSAYRAKISEKKEFAIKLWRSGYLDEFEINFLDHKPIEVFDID